MKNVLIVVITSILAIAYLSLSQAKSFDIEKSFKVAGNGALYLDSDSGSIVIESHDQETVEVRIRKKDNFNIDFSQDGNNVTIKGENESFAFFSNSSVSYRIKVPKKYDVDLNTGGGSIKLNSLIGSVDASTSGGSISLGKIKGKVKVKTSGGSIKINDVAGSVDAHTSGGSIMAKLTKQPKENSRLITSGGSVTAYLEPSLAVDLLASTSGGSVSSEFDVNGRIKRTKIEGEINGGGPKLTLKTSGGSVRVKVL